MQSRKEMKKKQVRSQHFMLRAIASHIWCEIFLVLEAIFHACEGTIGRNGPEIAEKLVELKEVKLSAVVVCGTVRMAGYVFQGRLDVKMWSWLFCVSMYTVFVCIHVCDIYIFMSLHCHCPPNEWSSSTMPTMHLQEEVGHYETYRENHLMLWLFMFSSRQNHVKRPSQWKKPKLHLKKAKVFRGSGFEVSGGKSKHQWIAGVASRLELVKMKFS